MEVDPQDVRGGWMSESSARAEIVGVDAVSLRRIPRRERDCCDERRRVPAGAGFWSGDPHEDLCSWCHEVVRDASATDGEHRRLARAGIVDDVPCYVTVDDDVPGGVARLAELVAAGELPRIALEQSPRLGHWLEAGGVLPPDAVVRRDGEPMRAGSLRLADLERILVSGRS